MGKRKLTGEQIKECIDLYNSGKTCKQIAEVYGVFDSSINRMLRRQGITLRPHYVPKCKLTHEEYQNCIDEYLTGLSIIDISKKLNISAGKVRYVITKEEIARGRHETTTCNPTKEERDECINLYKLGISMRKIEHGIGISRNSIRKLLTDEGLYQPPEITRYSQDDHFFDQIDTEAKSYFFGLLYADGCNKMNVNIIGISLQDSDKYILEMFRDELKSNRPVLLNKLKETHPTWNDHYELRVTSEHMCEVLNNYGMVPRKSLIKKFPEVILNSSEDIIRHFIRGYFCGNGSLTIKRDTESGTFAIFSTENMCIEINNCFKKYINIYNCSIYKVNNIFWLTTSRRENLQSIYNWLYKESNFFIVRKKEKFEKFNWLEK
jgi:hypothetical protein